MSKRQIITFVVCVVLCCLNFINAVQIEVLGPATADGRSVLLNFGEPADVYGLMMPNCHVFSSVEKCIELMDDVSMYANNGVIYTPSLPDRKEEDLTFRRGNVVKYLATKFNVTSYLEIGCETDEVFNQLREIVPSAVGVDPVKGGTHRMTSDAFFSVDNRTYDLIFIDGDHNAKQVILDVHNALRVLNDGGTIVMHDCNPKRKIRESYLYNGDTWKVIPYIRMMEDVEVVTLDLDHGVAVVRRRSNTHRMPAHLEDRMRRGAANPIEVFGYSDLVANRVDMLRLVTLAQFREWLEQSTVVV